MGFRTPRQTQSQGTSDNEQLAQHITNVEGTVVLQISLGCV